MGKVIAYLVIALSFVGIIGYFDAGNYLGIAANLGLIFLLIGYSSKLD